MPQAVFKNEHEVVIYSDTRELDTKVVDMLKKRCTVRERALNAGDYLLSDRVAIERKTTSDFIESIMDGRLFEQAARMKDDFEMPFILIEGGSLFETERKMHPNAIRGAISSIAVDMGIGILWAKNAVESAELMYAIAKREQTDNEKGISIRGKKKFRSENQKQEFLVAGISGVSTKTAKRLLSHFETPERVFTAQEEELKKVDGIGKVMAKRIRRLVTKKYEKSILGL